jgi:hypothetical protein
MTKLQNINELNFGSRMLKDWPMVEASLQPFLGTLEINFKNELKIYSKPTDAEFCPRSIFKLSAPKMD